LYLALDGHTKALRLAREREYDPAIAEGQRAIARMYAELRDTEQAVKLFGAIASLLEHFYRAALDGLKPNQQQAREELLLDLAAVLSSQGKLDEAERLTDEAIRIGIATIGEEYAGDGYVRRATILQARGDYAAGLQMIERAIAAGQRSDGARSVLVKRARKQELLSLLKRYPEAVAESEWVLKTAREVGDKLIERSAMRQYAQALFGNGDSAAAYQAMARFSELETQVLNSSTSRRIADLEASLKRRGLEAELALAEKARDVSRLQAERQRWVSIGAGVMGLALLAAVFALRVRVRHARAVNDLLQQQSARLRHASETDALTGLRNRRGAAHDLERISSGSELAVVLIDADHFKQINDRYGHSGGDDVLRELAARLLKATPKVWTVARWGGEEFLLFGPVASIVAPDALAESILQIIREAPITASGAAIVVTASLGFAKATLQDVTSWETLLQRADIALYEAKIGGRDRACFATET
jgi:diguanylate cyclase (GGDEF)-like protein